MRRKRINRDLLVQVVGDQAGDLLTDGMKDGACMANAIQCKTQAQLFQLYRSKLIRRVCAALDFEAADLTRTNVRHIEVAARTLARYVYNTTHASHIRPQEATIQ